MQLNSFSNTIKWVGIRRHAITMLNDAQMDDMTLLEDVANGRLVERIFRDQQDLLANNDE